MFSLLQYPNTLQLCGKRELCSTASLYRPRLRSHLDGQKKSYINRLHPHLMWTLIHRSENEASGVTHQHGVFNPPFTSGCKYKCWTYAKRQLWQQWCLHLQYHRDSDTQNTLLGKHTHVPYVRHTGWSLTLITVAYISQLCFALIRQKWYVMR